MRIAYHPSELGRWHHARSHYPSAPPLFLDNNPDEITPVLLTEDGTRLVGQHKVIPYLLFKKKPEEHI